MRNLFTPRRDKANVTEARKTDRCVFASVVLAWVLGSGTGACRAEVTDGGDGSVRDGQGDGGATRSPCPAPVAPGLDEIPAGYLPAVAVQLGRAIDGDTADLVFGDPGPGPDGADFETVRFLYVNTEESHGERTTRFGIDSAVRVRGELEGAREIVVAVRARAAGSGQPDVDAYGRWLGLLFVDGTLYQTHLVRAGLSAYYTRYGCAPEPVHTSLIHAEAEANAARRGIWAAGHPTDYEKVLTSWIGRDPCRPNPYRQAYCPP